jgi:hypothetical protein
LLRPGLLQVAPGRGYGRIDFPLGHFVQTGAPGIFLHSSEGCEEFGVYFGVFGVRVGIVFCLKSRIVISNLGYLSPV